MLQDGSGPRNGFGDGGEIEEDWRQALCGTRLVGTSSFNLEEKNLNEGIQSSFLLFEELCTFGRDVDESRNSGGF